MEQPKNKKEEIIIEMLEREKSQDANNFTLVLPSFIGKKLVSWTLIQCDILFAIDCAKQLITFKSAEQNDRSQIIETSLWYSLIITYGKCFTENESGYSKLEKKDCFDETNVDNELLEIHNDLIELRNCFIAHRGNSENENAIVYVKIPKNEPISEKMEVKISTTQSFSPSIEMIEKYLVLFNHIVNIVNDKIQKQGDKITLSFLEEIDPQYWKYLIK